MSVSTNPQKQLKVTPLELTAINVAMSTTRLLLWAWVATYLWKWFVPSVFPSLVSEIGVLQAAGLLLVVEYVTFTDTFRPTRSLVEILYTLFCKPLVFMTMGYVITLWM